jgi:hypothetical protein
MNENTELIDVRRGNYMTLFRMIYLILVVSFVLIGCQENHSMKNTNEKPSDMVLETNLENEKYIKTITQQQMKIKVLESENKNLEEKYKKALNILEQTQQDTEKLKQDKSFLDSEGIKVKLKKNAKGYFYSDADGLNGSSVFEQNRITLGGTIQQDLMVAIISHFVSQKDDTFKKTERINLIQQLETGAIKDILTIGLELAHPIDIRELHAVGLYLVVKDEQTIQLYIKTTETYYVRESKGPDISNYKWSEAILRSIRLSSSIISNENH